MIKLSKLSKLSRLTIIVVSTVATYITLFIMLNISKMIMPEIEKVAYVPFVLISIAVVFNSIKVWRGREVQQA